MRHGVSVPSNYTLYFKALITAEGVAHEVIPEVDPLEEMMPYVQQMAQRLTDEVDDLTVELNIFSAQLEADVLAHSSSEVPDELGERGDSLEEGHVRK